MSGAPVRYRGWEVRPAERMLLVRGAPVPIGSRAFDVLLALVERRGAMVTKSELLESAWAGLVVEENNVSVQVATLRKALGPGAIATVPGLGYRLTAVAEGAPEFAGVPSPSTSPSLSSSAFELLGRGQDLDELQERIETASLISIVGTGGVGKTSLARTALARFARLLPNVTYWIDLSAIREGREVVPLLAKALGVELETPAEAAGTLLAALGQMSAQVTLDNCEHVQAAVGPFVARALASAPGVRWLATSQGPLHVPGEIVYRLAPLTVPTGPVSLAQAMEYGAIALLCQRAVASNRRFRLDESNLDAAIALCTQLDGLPLAIEMAAARVATFGLDEVRQRLGERLRMLAGPADGPRRHSTLERTFDWSYDLLSPGEQAVFRRLEPFLGGFRADMAQQVASGDDDEPGIDPWKTLNAVGALVDKSLVQRSDDAPGRFHLLESARDYARSRLDAAGETAAVRRRHARAVAAWFGEARADADRMTDAEWARRYVPERHNVRVALAWACRDGTPDELAHLVTAQAMIDSFLCLQAEVLQCTIPLDVLAQAQPRLRLAACLELSWSHYLDGNRELGARLAQDACDTATALDDRGGVYRALAQLARLHESQPGNAALALRTWDALKALDEQPVSLRTRLFCGISAGLLHRPDRTLTTMRELEQLAEGAGFDGMAAVCRVNITDMLLGLGENEEVVIVARRILRVGDRLPRVRAALLHNEVLALIRLGRAEEALTPARAAFQAMPHAAHFLIDSFALAAARERRFADAAILHGCGTRIRQERREQPDRAEAASIAETTALLAPAIDDGQRAELMRLGASMTGTEAMTIKVFARTPPEPARDAAPAGLPGPWPSPGLR